MRKNHSIGLRIILYIFIVSIFLISPLLTFPILLALYFLDKEEKGVFYSLLIGLTLGFIVYHFIPLQGYDLIKHHNVVNTLSNKTFSDFLNLSKVLDLEFLPLLYSYLISMLNNVNLLQFFIVSLGYTIILYILYDYRKISNLGFLSFVSVFMFTIFGFNTLYFISGLYCYIAIIIFFYALYADYIKKQRKTITYPLYFLTLFIHSSMFLPFLLLIFFKLLKEKFDLKLIMLCVFIFVFSIQILTFVNNLYPTVIIERILYMLKVYFGNDSHYKIYYSGTIFFIEITKLIVTLICTYVDNTSLSNKKINDYIYVLSLSTILMMLETRVAIRYVMLIQFIGIVPLINVLRNKKNSAVYFFMIFILSIVYILFFINVFKNQNFGNLFDNDFLKSFINIFI